MSPCDARLPPPALRLRPRAAFRLGVALVATSLSVAALGLLGATSAGVYLLVATVMSLFTLALTAYGEQVPERIARRCFVAGAVVGGGLGGLVLFLFIVLLASRPTDDTIGIAILAVPLFCAGMTLSFAIFGWLVGLFGAGILAHEGSEALDVGDRALLATSPWLSLAGGAAAWASAGGPGAAMLVGLVLFALGVACDVVILVRALARARFLRRVAAGTEPTWILVEGAEGGDLPRYLSLASDRCTASIGRRPGAAGTPFRESARVDPVARIDPGAREALNRLRADIVRAGIALFLGLAFATASAHRAVTSPGAGPSPQSPASVR